MLNDRRRLEMANVAFNAQGKCIKHRWLMNCLSDEMILKVEETMSAFELIDVLERAQKRLDFIREHCDHVYKEHKEKFYCADCGHKFQKSEPLF